MFSHFCNSQYTSRMCPHVPESQSYHVPCLRVPTSPRPLSLRPRSTFRHSRMVCVMQAMSASRVDAYINVWRSISDQQSAIMCRTSKDPETIERSFKSLTKCHSKLDCLIFEMLFIRELKPELNLINSLLLSRSLFYRIVSM